jgi:hypothetical protein
MQRFGPSSARLPLRHWTALISSRRALSASTDGLSRKGMQSTVRAREDPEGVQMIVGSHADETQSDAVKGCLCMFANM